MKKKTPASILLGAVALLEDPSHWTKARKARDANGCSVSVDSDYACCFCAVGAIEKFSGRNTYLYFRTKDQADQAASAFTTATGIIHFNDKHRTTHDQLLKVMTTAAFMALAEEQPGHP